MIRQRLPLTVERGGVDSVFGWGREGYFAIHSGAIHGGDNDCSRAVSLAVLLAQVKDSPAAAPLVCDQVAGQWWMSLPSGGMCNCASYFNLFSYRLILQDFDKNMDQDPQ